MFLFLPLVYSKSIEMESPDLQWVCFFGTINMVSSCSYNRTFHWPSSLCTPHSALIHSAFLAHFWALHLLISLPDVKSASHLFGLWRKEGVLRKNTTAEHAIGRETDHGVLVPIQVDNQARCSKGTYCRANSQLELRYHLQSPPKVTIADSLDSEMHTY